MAPARRLSLALILAATVTAMLAAAVPASAGVGDFNPDCTPNVNYTVSIYTNWAAPRFDALRPRRSRLLPAQIFVAHRNLHLWGGWNEYARAFKAPFVELTALAAGNAGPLRDWYAAHQPRDQDWLLTETGPPPRSGTGWSVGSARLPWVTYYATHASVLMGMTDGGNLFAASLRTDLCVIQGRYYQWLRAKDVPLMLYRVSRDGMHEPVETGLQVGIVRYRLNNKA